MRQTSKVVPVKNQIRAIFPQLQLRPNFDTLDTNTGDIHQILNTLKYTYEIILFSWEGSRTERTGGVATRSNWFVLVSLEFVKVGSEGQFPPKKTPVTLCDKYIDFFWNAPLYLAKALKPPCHLNFWQWFILIWKCSKYWRVKLYWFTWERMISDREGFPKKTAVLLDCVQINLTLN